MRSKPTFAVFPPTNVAKRGSAAPSLSSTICIFGFEAQLAAVSGKATIAGAIRYTLSRWDGLTRFLDDGRIEMNSNVVERAIRPIALGIKSSLRRLRWRRRALGGHRLAHQNSSERR